MDKLRVRRAKNRIAVMEDGGRHQLAAAEPPTASPLGNEEFKRLNLSDGYLLVATTKDDCHFELADFIAPMVVQFLGVRSLVSFGATSKSHRAALANEVDRRKACIAEVEVEVTNLMALEKQSAKLSAYINRAIYLYGHDEGNYDGDEDGLDEMLSHLEEENGDVVINNPSRDNFLAAKILVYNAMHLIDDEVGIFHKRLVTTDDEMDEYFDIWEDAPISDHPDHAIAFPFGIDEPGDKINIFREERRKFFSRPMQGQAAKGALFILPACFYFPPRGGEMKRINSEDIEENARLAASIMVACNSVVGEIEDVNRFNDIIEENAIEMYQDDNYDAFRIVARELFFESKLMRDVLYQMINMADAQDFCRDCALGVDFDNISCIDCDKSKCWDCAFKDGNFMMTCSGQDCLNTYCQDCAFKGDNFMTFCTHCDEAKCKDCAFKDGNYMLFCNVCNKSNCQDCAFKDGNYMLFCSDCNTSNCKDCAFKDGNYMLFCSDCNKSNCKDCAFKDGNYMLFCNVCNKSKCQDCAFKGKNFMHFCGGCHETQCFECNMKSPCCPYNMYDREHHLGSGL